LKDIVYVKNNVSYLRQKLDAFLGKRQQRQSTPKRLLENVPTLLSLTLNKSFNRGYTDYFVNERHQAIGSWESPKSKGQYIGKLIRTVGNAYEIENGEFLNNGDGLCVTSTKTTKPTGFM
jgi:23S rRNA 5-hydroxycytidine C2501 synthase